MNRKNLFARMKTDKKKKSSANKTRDDPNRSSKFGLTHSVDFWLGQYKLKKNIRYEWSVINVLFFVNNSSSPAKKSRLNFQAGCHIIGFTTISKAGRVLVTHELVNCVKANIKSETVNLPVSSPSAVLCIYYTTRLVYLMSSPASQCYIQPFSLPQCLSSYRPAYKDTHTRK